MDLDGWAARVLETGSTCALGGDATWDALLAELGVRPLSPEERRRHVAEGPKRSRGALPVEVRWAITAVYERGRAAYRAMDMSDESERLERRLRGLVEEVTREHLARTSAAAPTTASIFANARATTPSYGGGVKAGIGQMKCKACGGPRKTQELGPCVYCGGELS